MKINVALAIDTGTSAGARLSNKIARLFGRGSYHREHGSCNFAKLENLEQLDAQAVVQTRCALFRTVHLSTLANVALLRLCHLPLPPENLPFQHFR